MPRSVDGITRDGTEIVSQPETLRRFLRFPQLKERCGIPYSRMHVDRLEKAGRFPKRIKLSDNLVVWDEAEIAAWQTDRMLARAMEAEPDPR
jgi:prophage regulatory protein